MIAIKGGTVYTMNDEKILHDAVILIEGGKIVDIGCNIDVPSDCEVIDAAKKHVMPGFIDIHTHVGIMEEVYRIEGNDTNETTDPVTPHLRAIDAINHEDIAFSDALSGGVTIVVVTPGSANVVGGEMVALRTSGCTVDDMVIKNPVGIKAALGENPKRVYGNDKKMPVTRMANAALLRKSLVETINYIQEKNKKRDLKLESLVPVIKGQLPLRVHAHRADDILTAVRIAEEFGIKIIIEHCTEGYKVADLLARKQIPVVIGPIITNRAKVELKGINLKNAAILHKAGVKFAIMTDHPVVPIKYLALSAALTVREGLPEMEALKAITLYPAQILGIDEYYGTLEPGKNANIVILSDDIFDIRCRVEQVFIEGKRVY
ncbi:MAG: amidohydrolase [Desulfotomaculum sp.]|nr:amidohydrolase [Desulfotomaculum sp.]MCL0062878.1 amidohydrolase [Peptococcaceae bacterium]